MPRVKLAVPEVDKVKGLFLERQIALGYSEAKMAELSGYSLATYRNMIRHRRTSDWKLCDILKLAKALGISKDDIRVSI